jgi:hypothetical protein
LSLYRWPTARRCCFRLEFDPIPPGLAADCSRSVVGKRSRGGDVTRGSIGCGGGGQYVSMQHAACSIQCIVTSIEVLVKVYEMLVTLGGTLPMTRRRKVIIHFTVPRRPHPFISTTYHHHHHCPLHLQSCPPNRPTPGKSRQELDQNVHIPTSVYLFIALDPLYIHSPLLSTLNDTFETRRYRGYGISDTSKYTEFTVKEFKLKTPGPRDVTIAIEYCGGVSLSLASHRVLR